MSDLDNIVSRDLWEAESVLRRLLRLSAAEISSQSPEALHDAETLCKLAGDLRDRLANGVRRAA